MNIPSKQTDFELHCVTSAIVSALLSCGIPRFPESLRDNIHRMLHLASLPKVQERFSEAELIRAEHNLRSMLDALDSALEQPQEKL